MRFWDTQPSELTSRPKAKGTRRVVFPKRKGFRHERAVAMQVIKSATGVDGPGECKVRMVL